MTPPPHTQADRIEEKVDLCIALLTGDKDSEKGLIVKVDRLVERDKSRTWLARTAIGASIAALIASIGKGFV